MNYEAALYAAGQARGLLNFAKAGTVMKYVNQALPFSNANLRGLGKSIHGFGSNPANYAMKWGLHVLLPTMAILAWNRRDKETWEEYLQLPDYRRDFFWNLKLGNHWITIPKPHLLGVLAGGAERIALSLMGEKHTGDNYATSLGNLLPANSTAQAAGPLKSFLELAMNWDSFRQKNIVPSWEVQRDLDLRKGTAYASQAGQGIANAMKAAGLGVDSRNVDYILNSMGGFGTMATSLTSKNRPIGSGLMRSTGLFTETPGADAKDVLWMLNWSKRRNELNNSDIKELKALRSRVFEEKDPDKRAELSKQLRDYATHLRNVYDK